MSKENNQQKKSTETRWYKSQSLWWVPLVVALATVITVFAQFYLNKSERDGWIVGRISGVEKHLTIKLDGKEVLTVATPSKMFRINNVSPGSHEIIVECQGYITVVKNITTQGGVENIFIFDEFVELPGNYQRIYSSGNIPGYKIRIECFYLKTALDPVPYTSTTKGGDVYFELYARCDTSVARIISDIYADIQIETTFVPNKKWLDFPLEDKPENVVIRVFDADNSNPLMALFRGRDDLIGEIIVNLESGPNSTHVFENSNIRLIYSFLF